MISNIIDKIMGWVLPAGSVLILMLMVSCGSSRKMVSTSESTATAKDSVRIEIRETTRIDTVKVPGERVLINQKVPCNTLVGEGTNPGDTDKPVVNIARSGRLNLKTTFYKGQLTAECTADSLELVIEAKDREITEYRNRERQTSEIQTVTKTVVKYRWPLWLIILCGLLGVMVLAKYSGNLSGIWMGIKKALPWK